MKTTILLLGSSLAIGMLAGCSKKQTDSTADGKEGSAPMPASNMAEDDGVEPEGLILATPVRLGIGSFDLAPNDGYTYSVANNPEGYLCSGCPPVVKESTLYARVIPETNGWMWLDSRDVNSSADTVVRIKYNNSVKTCDDDISGSDKRSEISKWPVVSGRNYYVSVSVKSNTTVYPLSMTVHLKTNYTDTSGPCYYRDH